MTSISDFQIIGGGINGLLLARELAGAGARVTLIEKGELGREASWAGGGIVSPLYPWRYSESITALANWAQDYYPSLAHELHSETGIDVELNATGLLMLDADDRDQACSWARHYSRELTEVNADQIYRREPGLRAGFCHGLWMPEVANVRNPRLLQALITSIMANDRVEVLMGSEVSSWEYQGDRLTHLLLSSPESSAQSKLPVANLVVTAGAWSGVLLGQLGVSIDVHPVKGQMLLFKFEQPPLRSIVLTAGRYLIPRQDGYLLAGSTLEYEQFDKTPSAEARLSLQKSAETLLPELQGMQPVGHWAGLRPGSGDGIPFIGAVPGWSNVFVNTGQFRNGLVLAPASARLAADLLLSRQAIIDPAPYDPGRTLQSID